MSFRVFVLLGLCASLVAGCDRGTLVRGTVADVQGNRLPGVAVTLRGADTQVMSNAVGEYAVRCPSGTRVLDFLKTDYTPGWLELKVPGEGTLAASAMQLFRLPSAQGVYLYENFQYHEMTRAELQAYRAPDRGPLWASKVGPELRTPRKQPLILFFKLPPYDTVLQRLEQVQAAPPRTDAASKYTESVWAPGRTLAAAVIPVDEPDHVLFELRPAEAIEPGVYAVSWGAFEGHTSTSPQVYLFEIVDPDKPRVEAQIEAPDAAKTPAKSAPKTKPAKPPAKPAPEDEPPDDNKLEG